jgi:hypothetical protein
MIVIIDPSSGCYDVWVCMHENRDARTWTPSLGIYTPFKWVSCEPKDLQRPG